MTKLKARSVLAITAVVGYILLTIGFFVVLFAGSKVSLPAGDLGIQIIGMVGMVVGTWGTLIGLVFTFHFGTSQSSAEKNEIIKEQINPPPP